MNWHSILRTSLQNFSNTQYMLNGAAHGSGVYVAIQVTYTLPPSLLGMQLVFASCLALHICILSGLKGCCLCCLSHVSPLQEISCTSIMYSHDIADGLRTACTCYIKGDPACLPSSAECKPSCQSIRHCRLLCCILEHHPQPACVLTLLWSDAGSHKCHILPRPPALRF